MRYLHSTVHYKNGAGHRRCLAESYFLREFSNWLEEIINDEANLPGFYELSNTLRVVLNEDNRCELTLSSNPWYHRAFQNVTLAKGRSCITYPRKETFPNIVLDCRRALRSMLIDCQNYFGPNSKLFADLRIYLRTKIEENQARLGPFTA